MLNYDEVIVLFPNFSLSFVRFIKAGKVNRLISLLSHIIQYEDGIAKANCLYLSLAYIYVSPTYAYPKSRTHRTSFVQFGVDVACLRDIIIGIYNIDISK